MVIWNIRLYPKLVKSKTVVPEGRVIQNNLSSNLSARAALNVSNYRLIIPLFRSFIKQFTGIVYNTLIRLKWIPQIKLIMVHDFDITTLIT